MKVIYGIPKDETERHTETLLCDIAETENDVEAVKEAASREGYHSFQWQTMIHRFLKSLTSLER